MRSAPACSPSRARERAAWASLRVNAASNSLRCSRLPRTSGACGRAIDGQPRRRIESHQLAGPELFAELHVAVLQPRDVVAVALTRCRRGFAAIVPQHLADQPRGAPAIEQQGDEPSR